MREREKEREGLSIDGSMLKSSCSHEHPDLQKIKLRVMLSLVYNLFLKIN